jgi:signal peptidase I
MLKHEHYVVKTRLDKFLTNLKGFFTAVLIALAIRVILIEPYKIPTPSMYPTILEGDMIMANKFWYGIRIPVANIKLPGFSDPSTGNIILFETPTYQSPGKFKELMNFVTFGIFGLDNTNMNPKYFIKRTLGTPGDTMQIINPRTNNFKYQLIINDKEMLLEPTTFNENFKDKDEYNFFLENLNGKKHFVQYKKSKLDNQEIYFPQDIQGRIYIPKEDDEITFHLIESNDNITAVKEAKQAGVSTFIHSMNVIKLEIKNNGKTKEVMTTGKITQAMYVTDYINTILTKNDVYQLLIDGKVTKKISEDYYFAMGDNRDNSSDSRYWGLVNQSLLLGSPLFRHYPFSRFGSMDRIEQK